MSIKSHHINSGVLAIQHHSSEAIITVLYSDSRTKIITITVW